MIDDGPVVSVIVPAFNAAETIQETLRSITQQTYRNLEVIVVDDGSSDGTAAIARRHSLTDQRFRVVSKPNGGVASARNEGIRASRGEFLAFIDADDLWHPTKLAKQLGVLLAGGPDMALVYAPFRMVDRDGRVLRSPRKYGVSGWVPHRHFYTNLVGNGSAILIRRDVVEEFGGFDSWLRDQGAEGCEDLLLQLRIAPHYQFGEVSEYLVGYRRFAGTMSSNAEQMIRSGILAVSRALSECRDIPGLSASAMLGRYEWRRLKAGVRKGRVRESLRSLARQCATRPAFVIGALWIDSLALGRKLGRFLGNAVLHRFGLRPEGDSLRHFYDFDPTAGVDLGNNGPRTRALRRLAKLDQTYRPKARAAAAAQLPRSSPDHSSEAGALTARGPRELNRSCSYQEG